MDATTRLLIDDMLTVAARRTAVRDLAAAIRANRSRPELDPGHDASQRHYYDLLVIVDALGREVSTKAKALRDAIDGTITSAGIMEIERLVHAKRAKP